MALSNTLFKQVLGVNNIVIEGIRIEEDPRPDSAGFSFVVEVRPHKSDRGRCPVCGRRCPGYDSPSRPQLWRSPDINGIRTYLSFRACRICCPEHGVRQEALPWAGPGTRFTRDFAMLCALMAMRLSRKAASELMRVDWATAQSCVRKAMLMLDPDPSRRLGGLVSIGIDETSYAKGHKYVTTVVNHDTGEVVWVQDGHSAEVLSRFFEGLTGEQRAGIRHVSADAATWIRTCVEKYCPGASLCLDGFHVVQWAVGAVDEVRRSVWNTMRGEAGELQKRLGGLPADASDEQRAELRKELERVREKATRIKGARYALGKNPENLTPLQRQRLDFVVGTSKELTRAHRLKEMVRLIFQARDGEEAESAFDDFFWMATHSRLEPFRKLAHSIREHWKSILNTIEIGLSNARIEANNNKIKLMIRKAFGFRNINSLLATIMLGCSNLRIPLPNRGGYGMTSC